MERRFLFYERKAGGAPFNVACGVRRFGADSAFVGCVGADTVGAFLEKFAKTQGLDELVLHRDETRNTTLAFVELDEAGSVLSAFTAKTRRIIFFPKSARNCSNAQTSCTSAL